MYVYWAKYPNNYLTPSLPHSLQSDPPIPIRSHNINSRIPTQVIIMLIRNKKEKKEKNKKSPKKNTKENPCFFVLPATGR
jgi:hypothetical protein